MSMNPQEPIKSVYVPLGWGRSCDTVIDGEETCGSMATWMILARRQTSNSLKMKAIFACNSHKADAFHEAVRWYDEVKP